MTHLRLFLFIFDFFLLFLLVSVPLLFPGAVYFSQNKRTLQEPDWLQLSVCWLLKGGDRFEGPFPENQPGEGLQAAAAAAMIDSEASAKEPPPPFLRGEPERNERSATPSRCLQGQPSDQHRRDARFNLRCQNSIVLFWKAAIKS